MRYYLLLAVLLPAALPVCAQTVSVRKDSIHFRMLDSVMINAGVKAITLPYLPEVADGEIFSGKRTQLVALNELDANLSQNMARMALAKVPGLVIWDMDGAGTQLNIGTRSTDAHRSIEINMRQNGYNTNSDMFGYPEDHYTPPLQTIEDIQYVKGSAAMQFGSQFGGMMNMIMKKGDSTKPFSIESEQTAGSNNFFNSYNAVGGTKGKFNYYAYVDLRHGDGWRDNATFNYHAYYVDLTYSINNKSSIDIQFSRMDYVQQIAGGLTDAQFKQNNRQSTRARNFFNPEINIPAITFKHAWNNRTSLNIQANGIFGERNSVQFINTPDIKDTFNTSLGSYNPRQVDRDYYTGGALEARLLHTYSIGHVHSMLAAGMRFSLQETKRKQKGMGTTGSDFDLSLIKPYGIDLDLSTTNYAAFAENVFRITPRLSITPGVRYEMIDSRLNGVINNATATVVYNGKRNFLLAGTGVQFQSGNQSQLYANISQAYRPYIYAAVTPATQVDKIDPDLKDSKGYDIDAGWRGHYKEVIWFDVDVFYLFYGNRVGLLSETDENGNPYLLSTNIGNSVAKGAEAYIEVSLAGLFNSRLKTTDLRLFNSLAYDNARYTSAMINKAGTNVDIAGNYVENSPTWITKTGLRFLHKQFSTTVQFSYSGKSYNDALNTEHSANGVLGVLPAWHIWDWAANYHFKNYCSLSAGINNLTDVHYFNRRITMYPGPGILPADGRTFYISLGFKI